MMKKVILLCIMVATLSANGIFSRLPYGMKLGTRIPYLKVEKRLVYKDYQYQITGKFVIDWNKETGVLKSVSFGYDFFDIPTLLPRAWRIAGLRLCEENRDGTPYEKVKALLKRNGAYEIDEVEDSYRKMLYFKVDGDKQYEMTFFKDRVKDEHGKGLAYITITPTDDENYDDSY
ncbi:hypothetical protein MNB_SM-3-1529 [hydrothermal vent metagenome]|uniref:Uncharacterized protein n=1 Tax=hydrothermal vent metagenome TaxID=652676 RepID=A0A1W1D2Y5_9ZZZZ